MRDFIRIRRRRGRPRLSLEEYALRHADFLVAMQTSKTISEACEKVGFGKAYGTMILKRLGYRRVLMRGRIR